MPHRKRGSRVKPHPIEVVVIRDLALRAPRPMPPPPVASAEFSAAQRDDRTATRGGRASAD
jgi:hypothetical protein